MSEFTIEPYKDLLPDELRQKLRTVVRQSIHKDQLICMLVQSGIDGMPAIFADEVHQIVSAYCDGLSDEELTP